MNTRPQLWLAASARLLIAGLAGVLCFDACPASLASPQPLPTSQLTNLIFQQKLGAQLSLNLPFQDEDYGQVELSQYFGSKPVILVLGYYECPMLCNLVLNGLVESLQNLKLSAGKDFNILFVSIDPKETPALASAKKRIYAKRYGRSEAGWHFLTSRNGAAEKLAREVGFHYAYDASIKQYAHPSGIVVLTPSGRTSRYFLGVSYPSQQLHVALSQATSNQTGSPAQQLMMLCFRFMPLTGKYSGVLMMSVRVLAVMTFLGLACLILTTRRRAPEQEVEQRNAARMSGL